MKAGKKWAFKDKRTLIADKIRSKKKSLSQKGKVCNAKKQQISFELISRDYFIVRFKNYMNHDCLKEMNSLATEGHAMWNREAKHWTVENSCYDKLLAKILRIVKGDEEPLLPFDNSKSNLLNLQNV